MRICLQEHAGRKWGSAGCGQCNSTGRGFCHVQPKTGSTALWTAIQRAAETSGGKFRWFGHKFKGQNALHIKDRDFTNPDSEPIKALCTAVAGMHAQGSGAYALHTEFLEFSRVCPEARINAKYIQMLRDPLDRMISNAKYKQACICNQLKKKVAANIRYTTWCNQHGELDATRRDMIARPRNNLCTWSVNELVQSKIAFWATQEQSQHNMYVRYFCNKFDARCAIGLDAATKLDAAKRGLLTNYDWVGILEAPVLSMQLLRVIVPQLRNILDLTHVSHRGDMHANISDASFVPAYTSRARHSHHHLSPHVYAAARALVQEDYEIYDYAVRLLKDRLALVGIPLTPELADLQTKAPVQRQALPNRVDFATCVNLNLNCSEFRPLCQLHVGVHVKVYAELLFRHADPGIANFAYGKAPTVQVDVPLEIGQ